MTQAAVTHTNLASDPKATVQSHEPICDRFYTLSLPLLDTIVSQTSAWLLS